VKQDNDWKDKYQAMVKELDAKKDEWNALDEILRKVIGRMSIAGRGADRAFDQRLKDIQNFRIKNMIKNN
jgi:hypothetical protein